MRIGKFSRRAAFTAAAAAAMLGFGATPAVAETQIGWTGATLPIDGQIFMHNSTVTNDGPLAAKSKIWTMTGAEVDAFHMAVRARLFKGSVICQVVDYQYNATWAASLEIATSGDCGSGPYNSHGFVKTFSSTNGFQEHLTFPSSGIGYTAPAPALRSAPSEITPFAKDGKTFGVLNPEQSDAVQPDFVAAYTNDGQQGYIRSTDLNAPVASVDSLRTLPQSNGVVKTPARDIPVFAADGASQIGVLTTA